LQAGADALITSAHKALPAYSQAALLLARTERLDVARLDRAFDTAATTSPSGTILASIDASRAVLSAPLGHELLDRLVTLVAAARTRLRSHGHTVPGPGDFAPGRFDPAKLVVLLDRVDGNAVEQVLIAAGVPVEQADRDMLMPMVAMLDDETTIDRLCSAIESVEIGEPRPRAASTVWTARIPPSAMSPRTAFFAAHESVPAAAAAGRISAELIAPYPPGIPVLTPGELITAETINALGHAAHSGVRIAYAADPTLSSYQVVVE
jgi:lysine decarboxylase